ncbi:glycine--tRNA ligase subunit beta [Heliorestis acidaminivorans]|uniref:Glycine--tRNA ligase beta subunit n=1 Tax=Heliorestis acidaminivorans TaxID=553427 RepID=A0A6I0ERK5_9FIRM|nr:glycine--tRNA ligase subunit beta [Heliorestis acidaminivorans]KAB2952273.1 glycine--tRNA ligase subunit beta [Heliorestis acidaminivorans]
MKQSDLLLEIGVEEIPAKFMPATLKQLKGLAVEGLQEARLSYQELHVYGTPRRIAIKVKGLATLQQDLQVEAKGPSVKVAYDQEGQPTKALLGFARSQSVEPANMISKEINGVPYLFALRTEKGQLAIEVLPGLLKDWIGKLSFPKPMRWGWGEMRFARPIRWLVALYGESVLPLELEGVQAGRRTYGHRFLAEEPIDLAHPEEYEAKLESAYVIADPDKRRQEIWQQIQELAVSEGGQVAEDKDLLEEINYLVEYPTALCGRIDEKYMQLPEAVLITPMKEHQRYFPVISAEGRLLPKFITVRNGTTEHLEIVQAGNEKVLRARLADGAFFYEEDQKVPLDKQVKRLEKIVFHEKLGTVYERVEREKALTTWLAQHLEVEQSIAQRAYRAAELAKADLVTLMVYEFPELQGLMGEKYALLSGEAEQVAQAIREHYLPRYAGDTLPETMEGTLVAIADKVDAIVGSFAIGIIPTGSQDPYALRRQAQALCLIAMKKDLSLSLSELFKKSYELYSEKVELSRNVPEVLADLLDFFYQRLRFLLSEEAIRYDVIDAVLEAGIDKPNEVYKRAKALAEFREEEAFSALLTTYTRAANLAKKGGQKELSKELLQEPVEKTLYEAIMKAQGEIDSAQGDYALALRVMAQLQEPLDAFFDQIMVMVENEQIRENRLALLKAVDALMDGIADLNKIVN